MLFILLSASVFLFVWLLSNKYTYLFCWVIWFVVDLTGNGKIKYVLFTNYINTLTKPQTSFDCVSCCLFYEAHIMKKKRRSYECPHAWWKELFSSIFYIAMAKLIIFLIPLLSDSHEKLMGVVNGNTELWTTHVYPARLLTESRFLETKTQPPVIMFRCNIHVHWRQPMHMFSLLATGALLRATGSSVSVFS